MATATIGVIVALAFGRFVLGIPIGGPGTQWGLLVLVTALGLVSVSWLGIVLAGASLVVARHSINMNEGLTGLLYLLSGAVFPIQLLPHWAQSISLALPFGYWLELIRRIVTGRSFSGPLARYSDAQLWLILAAATAAISIGALIWFRACEHTARARGLFDWKTNY
jgi:ABC-2 type transport system permease protein